MTSEQNKIIKYLLAMFDGLSDEAKEVIVKEINEEVEISEAPEEEKSFEDEFDYNSRIVGEIEKLLSSGANDSSKVDLSHSTDYISLHDYANFLMKYVTDWTDKKIAYDKDLLNHFGLVYNAAASKDLRAHVEVYNLVSRNLKIYIRDCVNCESASYVLKKENGFLKMLNTDNLTKANTTWVDNEMLARFYPFFSCIYDDYVKNETIIASLNDQVYTPVLGNVEIGIQPYYNGYNICFNDSVSKNYIFGICSFNREYWTYDNNSVFSKLLINKEYDIMSNTYFKIDELPVYFQSKLRVLRAEALENKTKLIEAASQYIEEGKHDAEDDAASDVNGDKTKRKRFPLFGM